MFVWKADFCFCGMLLTSWEMPSAVTSHYVQRTWLVPSFLEAAAPCVIRPSVQAGNIFPLAKPPLIIMGIVLPKKSRTQTEPGESVCDHTVPFNRDTVEQRLTLYWNENLHLVSWIENVWLHICGNLKQGNKIHSHLCIWTKEMIVCRFKYF